MNECGDYKKNPELCGFTDDDYIDPEEVLFSDEDEAEVKGLSDEDYIDPETALDDDMDESCSKKNKKNSKKAKWLPFKEYIKKNQQIKEALKIIEDAGLTAKLVDESRGYKFTRPSENKKYIKVLKTLFDCGGYLDPKTLKSEVNVREGTDQSMFASMTRRFLISYNARRNLWFIMPDGLDLLKQVYPDINTKRLFLNSHFRTLVNKVYDDYNNFGERDKAWTQDVLDRIAISQGISPDENADDIQDNVFYGTELDGDERNDDSFYPDED